jgi:hypothetical protein
MNKIENLIKEDTFILTTAEKSCILDLVSAKNLSESTTLFKNQEIEFDETNINKKLNENIKNFYEKYNALQHGSQEYVLGLFSDLTNDTFNIKNDLYSLEFINSAESFSIKIQNSNEELSNSIFKKNKSEKFYEDALSFNQILSKSQKSIQNIKEMKVLFSRTENKTFDALLGKVIESKQENIIDLLYPLIEELKTEILKDFLDSQSIDISTQINQTLPTIYLVLSSVEIEIKKQQLSPIDNLIEQDINSIPNKMKNKSNDAVNPHNLFNKEIVKTIIEKFSDNPASRSLFIQNYLIKILYAAEKQNQTPDQTMDFDGSGLDNGPTVNH